MQSKGKRKRKKLSRKCFAPGIEKTKVKRACILNMSWSMVVQVEETMQMTTAQGMKRLTIEETGYGASEGNDSEQWSEDDNAKTAKRDHKQKAGKMFGKEHVNVVYEEQRVAVVDEQENRQKLIVWRDEQKPFVRSFVEEMKKTN